MGIKHAFTSAKGEGPDATLVRAGDWNADHTVSDIVDFPTAEDDDTLVLAPDGTGGVKFRAETGGGGGGDTGARYPVQEKSSGGSSSTSHSATMNAAPTVGNLLLIVAENEGSMDVASITQTNVTWTKVYGTTPTTVPVVELWKGVIAGSPGTGITVAWSGSAAFGGFHVSEWTGLAGTIDQSASRNVGSGSGDTSRHPIPLIHPTDVTALVISGACQSGWGTSFTAFEGPGMVLFYGANGVGAFWGFLGLSAAYGYTVATGTYPTASGITVSII